MNLAPQGFFCFSKFFIIMLGSSYVVNLETDEKILMVWPVSERHDIVNVFGGVGAKSLDCI